MAAAKKDTKDSSAEVEALKAELEKTRKALAESLEQIEKLKEKETGKPAAQPKEKTIKDGHEYVDLGLSVKWATCNVGASKPEEYGYYFAWGETGPKEKYTEENSLTYGKQMSDIAGNAQYDAARANWGGNWRMPTKTEMQELIDKCKWEWVAVNGVNGYKGTGPNGNKIFLPATGFRYGSSRNSAGSSGYYWGSSPYESGANDAYSLGFHNCNHDMYNYYRYYGLCIRPVSELEETRKVLAESLEQIEKLKEKETGKPAAQPKEKTIKDGHEYVDLGLSVKWATCNVGASKPEDYGNYYAWGETTTKSSYTVDNSKTYGKFMVDINGNSSYDAARANWGGNWRMPTKTEMQELIDKCKWKWVTVNGVNGYKVTSKTNGNSIFLPATGRRYGSSLNNAGSDGYYWSSTPNDGDAISAYFLYFNSGNHYVNYYYRYYGRCIRPVSELEETRKVLAESLEQIEKLKNKETGKPAAQPKEKTIKDVHEYVDLGLSVKWATCNVGANKPEEYGNYYAWGETAPKSEYTVGNSKTYRITLYVPDQYDDVPTVESTEDWSMPTRAEIRELHPKKKLSDIAGYVEYDAATANWGGRWRMPTRAEQQELLNNCTWTRTRQNEVNGYKVTGPNGKSIFLPAAGCRSGSSLIYAGRHGYYWSSTPDGYDDGLAYNLLFNIDFHYMHYHRRYYGHSVRPVLE